MRLRIAFIKLLCLQGSMHLVTTTTVSSFHRFSVPLCRHVIKRPCNWATITPCHLPHHPTVPPATNMPQPCRRETWYDTVTPPWHRATWCAIVPPGRPSCYRATWCATVQPGAPPFYSVTWYATVPPYRRVAALLIRYIGILLYPCQS